MTIKCISDLPGGAAPGLTHEELDAMAKEVCRMRGGAPDSFVLYREEVLKHWHVFLAIGKVKHLMFPTSD